MSFASRRRLALVIAVALMLAMTLPSTGIAAIALQTAPAGIGAAGVSAAAVWAPDTYENDDTTSTAKFAPATSFHTFETSATNADVTDDVDWFKITVPTTNAPVVMEVVGASNNGRTATFGLQVFRGADASGTLSTTTPVYSGSSNNRLLFYSNWAIPSYCTTPGTYYIKLTSNVPAGYYLDLAIGSGVRAGGADRYGTAIELSKRMYPATRYTETIFLATGQQYADALAAGSLARDMGAPILLTQSGTLPAAVLAEIDRISSTEAGNRTTVYILGGTAAVSTAVENAVKAVEGVWNVKRIGGADRYATAALVARQTTESLAPSSIYTTGSAFLETTQTIPTVFVASGQNFPDALVVGPVAAAVNSTHSVVATDGSTAWFLRRTSAPVLLVQQSALPSATSQFLRDARPRQVYVCGGSVAVATSVVTAIQSVIPSGSAVTRVAGADRYETAYKLATHGRTAYSMTSSATALASGGNLNWPDGLTIAPFSGLAGAWSNHPVLITPPTSLSPWVTKYYKDVDGFREMQWAAGGPAAISATTFNAWRDLYKTPIN